MRILILCALVCCAAVSTRAQPYSGTVSGTITSADPRADPYLVAGYPAASAGNNGGAARLTNRFSSMTVPVSQVLVQVCVSLAYAPCLNLWTRTNGAGQYNVPWSGFLPPTSIRVRVYAQQPNIGIGAVVASDAPPEATFRITTAGVTDIVIGESTVTTSLTGNRSIGVSVAGGEPTAAFITAREVYSVLGAQTVPPGGSVLSDMQGVNIFVNQIGSGFVQGGIAPTDDEVLLSPGTAAANPFTVAHELGHVLAWRSMNIALPPYEFSAYSACGIDGGASWTDFSNECEKPAFWEGFAHVVAGFWMWIPTVRPTNFGFCAVAGHGIPRSGSCISLENPSQNPASTLGAIGACGSGSGAQRRAMCNARGLWDLADRPNGLERDLGEFVRVLRAYPSVCLPAPFDNRCVNEFGYDGTNWKDYKANHLGQFSDDQSALDTAEISNNLQGSVND